MASYPCPSCGQPFNGKRCSHCCYEHFSEEIAHGTHTHQGEPLVINASSRKPIPQKDPFDCPPQWRQTSTQKHRSRGTSFSWLFIGLILYLILYTLTRFLLWI